MDILIKIQDIPPAHTARVNEMLADGVVTDSEIVEIMGMKLGIDPYAHRDEYDMRLRNLHSVIGRISIDRTTRRNLIWLAIVGTAVLIALLT